MKIACYRYSTQEKTTLGILYDVTTVEKPVFLAYTLEDTYREEKIYGETRIPQGEYILKLRTVGGFYARYVERFKDVNHTGMIEVADVPNYTAVLIHCGNYHRNTAGCLLVADGVMGNLSADGNLLKSTDAYKRVYTYVRAGIASEPTTLRYIDVA
jgi:hypothetical protein